MCGVAISYKVRELATKAKNLKKDGVAKPFVFCELKKCACASSPCIIHCMFAEGFLPPFFPEPLPVAQSGELAKSGGSKVIVSLISL